MKIVIAIVLGLVLTIQAPSRTTTIIRGPVVAAGGGTCTELIALYAFGGNNEGAFSTVAQKIKNTSGMTVCSVDFVVKGTGNATCGLWSNPDGTGTQYGTTSSTTALSGSYAETVFTWASNPTVPSSTDFYIVVSGSLDGNQFASGDAYETGNGYHAYTNGTEQTGSDIRFGFSTIQ